MNVFMRQVTKLLGVPQKLTKMENMLVEKISGDIVRIRVQLKVRR